jgi:hypothetical protein
MIPRPTNVIYGYALGTDIPSNAGDLFRIPELGFQFRISVVLYSLLLDSLHLMTPCPRKRTDSHVTTETSNH